MFTLSTPLITDLMKIKLIIYSLNEMFYQIYNVNTYSTIYSL